MKKKQKQKLLKQFRPSFEQVRLQLFENLEKLALQNHQLAIRVYIDPKKLQEMTIELLGETHKEQILSVPMDENFVTVLKRIQKQEAGLMERFSLNLANEIAGYWAPARQTQPVAEKAVQVAEPKEQAPEEAKNGLDFQAFREQIEAFPKFFVETEASQLLIKEKGKEDRLLATISTTEENDFTIEKALERKYKLKTEVIPVIEEFAKTPLNQR
ncbi:MULTISPECIES: hypothetical protein [Enterococcus]|uniref:hypothetical protein n=1 Tax=Enterococcus TaxID=1350 RepID=UPI00065E50B2|nr:MULTISPECIES: hypothetical protein [Enterococcus]KAF1304206.1 hypothetical protein BAU16_02335 [Enterococcus sp. JM9B]